SAECAACARGRRGLELRRGRRGGAAPKCGLRIADCGLSTRPSRSARAFPANPQSAIRNPQSPCSWLPRSLSQKYLNAPHHPPRIPPLSLLAPEQRLLLREHDEQAFGERRRHPRRAHQRVVPPPHAEVPHPQL